MRFFIGIKSRLRNANEKARSHDSTKLVCRFHATLRIFANAGRNDKQTNDSFIRPSHSSSSVAFVFHRRQSKSNFNRGSEKADSVFVAADTKVVTIDQKTSTAETKSKIVHLGNLAYFAMAGVAGYPDLDFDPQAIAYRSYQNSKTLLDCTTKFGETVKPLLEQALKEIRKKNYLTYVAKFRGSKRAVSAVFCGVENGVTVAYIRDFAVKSENEEKIEIIILGEESDSTEGLPRILGYHDSTVAYANQHPELLAQLGVVAYLNKLIELEIQADPDYTGPPIEILNITPRKAAWLQNPLNENLHCGQTIGTQENSRLTHPILKTTTECLNLFELSGLTFCFITSPSIFHSSHYHHATGPLL